jgi:hypothetical protein
LEKKQRASLNRCPNYPWPQTAQSLQLSFFQRLRRVSLDIFLFLVTLGFIGEQGIRTSLTLPKLTFGRYCHTALGTLVIILRDDIESQWGNQVLEAVKVSPTLWPLVFAAVIGSRLRASAHKKAQHGTTLGVNKIICNLLASANLLQTLEQLMGSQTTFGVMKYAFVLRSFGFSTIMLIILWAFNPIGGQASLRSISLETNIFQEQPTLRYLSWDPRYSLKAIVLVGLSSYEMYRPHIASMYGATLFSPDASLQYSNESTSGQDYQEVINRLGGKTVAVQRMATDMWGNVRVPALHLLPGYNEQFKDTWVAVPENDIPPYASIIGVPLRQQPVDEIGNLTMNIETNYHRFKVSCIQTQSRRSPF